MAQRAEDTKIGELKIIGKYLVDDGMLNDAMSKFTQNLMHDIQHNRLRVDGLYPMYKLEGLHYRYGLLEEDDVVFLMADVEEIQRFNPNYAPPGVTVEYRDAITGETVSKFKPAKQALCFQLNPQKYSILW